MNPTPLYFAIQALFASSVLLVFSSCQGSQTQQNKTAPPPEKISIVTSLESASLLSNAITSFQRDTKTLPNGAEIFFEHKVLPALQAAEKISRGELKPTLWIAPYSSLVEYSNSNIINLGARQDSCHKIFSTRLVAAIGRAQRKKLFPATFAFSAAQLLAKLPDRILNVPRPDMHDTGIAAALYLLGLDKTTLASPEDYYTSLRRFGNEDRLLSGTIVNYFGTPRISLTSEQKIITHNRSIQNPDALLEALYLNDSPVLDYTACISDADWINPAQKAAAELFKAHLLSQEVQVNAQQLGFRAVRYVTDTINSFIPALGVKATPEESAMPIPYARLAPFLANQHLVMPTKATMVVVDCSGSMKGTPMHTAKRLVKSYMLQGGKEVLTGVVSFSSISELLSPPVAEKRSLLPYVAGLEANGGSALYDAILLAAEQLQKPEYSAMQRQVIVITDGNDQSSKTSLAFFGSSFQRRSAGKELGLSVFFLPSDGVDTMDLKQIVELFDGSLFSITPSISFEEFKQLVENGS